MIFCFDGSWNKLDTKSYPTNVVLLAESVPPVDHKGVQQIVYYDEGVGTASDETIRGGAFGKGLVQNIREAYRFLIFNHLAGDEIFVFGFSRGAFTARSFIGFIRAIGILKVNDANQINEAWALYQKHAVRNSDTDDLLKFRARYCPDLCVNEAERDWRRANDGVVGTSEWPVLRIRYCGVWDTVGTLGWKAVSAVVDRRKDKTYDNHDTDLSDTVDAARHAVALDERRIHFLPTLWRNVTELNARVGKADADADSPYQQKWFAGDHGSVGGGGPERGLSNAALHWVLRGAITQGLSINLAGRSQLDDIRYNARAALHNTPQVGLGPGRIGIGAFRSIVGWVKDAALTAVRSGPTAMVDIHPSVLRRWFTKPEELPERRPYRPAALRGLIDRIQSERSVFAAPIDETIYPRHIVTEGENLSVIARDRLGHGGRWQEIFEINRDVLDIEHDIFPGDELRLPPDARPSAVKNAPSAKSDADPSS
nr:DUF2235 domain-containing protein [Sphingomonas sp. CFBP 8760]